MAVKTFNLPVCDVCGKVWLPDEFTISNKISARQDPRAYDAARKKNGLTPLRCGKCKSYRWDREFIGDRRFKNPHEQT